MMVTLIYKKKFYYRKKTVPRTTFILLLFASIVNKVINGRTGHVLSRVVVKL